MSTSDHYRDAGVDIDAGNAFVEAIKPIVKSTRRPGVLSDLGAFAGFFALERDHYRAPVLVSSCDGVGTKLLVSAAAGQYRALGVDLVAMCVNDVLVHGAEPLFFLDYLACGSLADLAAEDLVAGVGDGCRQARVALLGGETAEMPGLYGAGKFDLSGFAVGVVERDGIIDGSGVRAGSELIGVASSGLHANGFSLVRKLLFEERNYQLDDRPDELDDTLGNVLTAPTKIYVRPALQAFHRLEVLSAAHITGGGLIENLPRMLPRGAKAVIDFDSWPKPPIFSLIQREGMLPDEEMTRVFNAGIGFVLVVAEGEADAAIELFAEHGEKAWCIGHVASRGADEPSVLIRRAA